jgi:hypothetical protein
MVNPGRIAWLIQEGIEALIPEGLQVHSRKELKPIPRRIARLIQEGLHG